MNALKPPNPSKIVRSQAGTQKAGTPSVSFLFFTPALGPHTHSETSVSVITASLGAASSFPQQEKRKGEKDPAPPSGTLAVFLYSGNGVQTLTNTCWSEAEGPKSVHRNLPLLLRLSLTVLKMYSSAIIPCLYTL